MANENHKDALHHLGASAKDIARELTEFTEAAKVLSSDHPRLIDEHPLQWVGVYHGRVAASAPSLKSLMDALAEKGVPAERAIIRFIDKEERTLIL